MCNDHIVCAGSDGNIYFYDAQFNRVHALPSGGTSVKHLVCEHFMQKDLLLWSMDVVMPTVGGVPVGVVQMMDFSSLVTQPTNPPIISVLVKCFSKLCYIFLPHICNCVSQRGSDLPYTHPQSVLKFVVVLGGPDLNLITSGEDGTVRTWSFNSYTSSFDHIHCYEGHLRGVSGLAFNGSPPDTPPAPVATCFCVQ